MATHFSILAWRISWAEESGGLQSMGLQRVRHNWVCVHTHAHVHIHTVWVILFLLYEQEEGNTFQDMVRFMQNLLGCYTCHVIIALKKSQANKVHLLPLNRLLANRYITRQRKSYFYSSGDKVSPTSVALPVKRFTWFCLKSFCHHQIAH